MCMGVYGKDEGSRRVGRLAKLCLRNDVGHKSFVISESGLREGGGGIADECEGVCSFVGVCVQH